MASVAPSMQPERLNQIFNGLKNKNAETRAQSAKDLYHFVSIISYILNSVLNSSRGSWNRCRYP